MKVGDRYRIRDNDNIQDEFRGRLFTVTKIDTDYYYVLLDDEDRTHHIDKNDWLRILAVGTETYYYIDLFDNPNKN